jgi:hydroxyacylglutathione hydrolase
VRRRAQNAIAAGSLTPYLLDNSIEVCGGIMAAEIRVFNCLSDNFGYLIHDTETRATASIDAPEAAAILKVLAQENWALTDILITHHHHDHVGGVAELKQKYKCRVVAPHDRKAAIADVDQRVTNGDVVKVGNLLARVIETPGHTLDHVSYVFDKEKAVFAADTLFSIGCGRVFEGTPAMMWDSLLKLRALPDDFNLYCGHEYTASNVKFALTVDGDNPALQARAEEVTRLRAQNRATIPVQLGEEKKSNVFLRADDPAVAAALHMKGAAAADVFGELRERKNKS